VDARSGRPLAAVSLKAYLGQDATLSLCRQVRRAAVDLVDTVDLAIIPIATTIGAVAAIFDGSGVSVGAQDCSRMGEGPYTGELPVEALRAAGATIVEVGHAERRLLFGESEETIARKVERVVANGLLPLVCVGEAIELTSPDAAQECLRQLSSALSRVPDAAPAIVAYEPVWAIGADEPAAPGHVRPVCEALKRAVAGRGRDARVIYGGTAGPGLYSRLAPAVDGLFLGRRAHDVGALVTVMQEMAAPRGRALSA
jgi:triosephosphate isomerase